MVTASEVFHRYQVVSGFLQHCLKIVQTHRSRDWVSPLECDIHPRYSGQMVQTTHPSCGTQKNLSSIHRGFWTEHRTFSLLAHHLNNLITNVPHGNFVKVIKTSHCVISNLDELLVCHCLISRIEQGV